MGIERNIAETLLGNDFESQHKALQQMGKVYLEIAGFETSMINDIFQRLNNDDSEIWKSQYISPTGEQWGMDTMDAFRCLVDTNRTIKLINGIFPTVSEIKHKTGRKLKAIDAGTGTGIMAMALAWAGVEKVYGLEINPGTAKIAPEFIKEFGLSDRVEVFESDATQVMLPKHFDGDILVSENLSNGLFDEPQYHIIKHLSQYLRYDAKIIPYKATVYVGLGHSEWEGIEKDNITISARNLKDLSRKTDMHPYYSVVSTINMEIPHVQGEVEVNIPKGQEYNTLIISSQFQIDDGQNPMILAPDTANFLGKSSAFRLSKKVISTGENICISLDYPTGMPKRRAQISVSDANVVLAADNDWVAPK